MPASKAEQDQERIHLEKESNFLNLLKRSGLTKVELATRLGVNRGTVSGWGLTAPAYAMGYLRLYCEYVFIKRATEKILNESRIE